MLSQQHSMSLYSYQSLFDDNQSITTLSQRHLIGLIYAAELNRIEIFLMHKNNEITLP